MPDLSTSSFANGAIEVTFLEQMGLPGKPDAGRDAQIAGVTDRIVAFIREAHSSLDLAIYDFRLDGAAGDRIVTELTARAKAGVAIRIAHDPTTSPAAPVPGGDATVLTQGGLGKPPGAEDFLKRLADVAQIKPIKGFKALMHNKYIIRDGLAAEAAVLMGSTNFTNDAWGLQENNLVVLHAQELAAYYATDFMQLWSRGKITDSTGYHDTGTVRVGGVPVTVAFTPGESATIVHAVVNAIEVATSRLTIAAMVMSSGPIGAAVSEALDRGVPVVGLYDGPQMDTVLRQWAEAGIGADKANTWHKVAAHLSRKESIPYAPGTPHNFMHLKLVVADDIVVTGSFNFSNHARGNAENTILIKDKAVADAYDFYIKGLAARYAKT
ncbi:Phosphatidylserine/phosphatidylglycerophosphate/cardiolipin synthase [Rhizobiales bacterium GAS191]|jgi:phosphatidylserine/phosphatidylglycerophosphate/cardiolipin synthase-like enzyme|nr:Phosphatidylserine/phosphatidylglycerophosphate/cardiolipin synthase [Rhizobiales bacterium GAS113]SEE32462.1 Phosphatidylserine/phosphatidylglycerophosphate/cardiolipin synthase [Rhizobiales bacterium GAS191]